MKRSKRTSSLWSKYNWLVVKLRIEQEKNKHPPLACNAMRCYCYTYVVMEWYVCLVPLFNILSLVAAAIVTAQRRKKTERNILLPKAPSSHLLRNLVHLFFTSKLANNSNSFTIRQNKDRIYSKATPSFSFQFSVFGIAIAKSRNLTDKTLKIFKGIIFILSELQNK